MTTTSCVAKQSFPASMGDIFLRDITHTIGLVRDPSPNIEISALNQHELGTHTQTRGLAGRVEADL